MTTLLRVEAVNLANFVYDTNDLSTVRGGSRLLLDAPEIVERALADRLEKSGAKKATVRRISGGASTGLFDVEAEGVASSVVERVVNGMLRDHDDLKHATVLAAACPYDPAKPAEFERAVEALTARIRWRQYERSSLSVEGLGDAAVRPCSYDLTRPATSEVRRRRSGPVAGSPEALVMEPVSLGTKQRHLYGREQKHALAKLVGAGDDAVLALPAVYHFEQMADDPPAPHQRLAGKIAVLHLDGMGFGLIQRLHATDPQGRKAWDEAVQSQRTGFLRSLLQIACHSGNRWLRELSIDGSDDAQKQPHYRLELLTWGGDDIAFVAPAWCGWELAARFFAASEGSGPGIGWSFKGEAMRYAGGLVFCHAAAPIQRIRSLAEELGGLAKDFAKQVAQQAAKRGAGDGPKPTAKEGGVAEQGLPSALLPLVLESFDDLGGDASDLLKRRFSVDATDLILHGPRLGSAMSTLADHMDPIRATLARRKLVAAASATSQAWRERSQRELDETIESSCSAAQKQALSLLGQGRPRAVGLAELWDYLIPGRP